MKKAAVILLVCFSLTTCNFPILEEDKMSAWEVVEEAKNERVWATYWAEFSTWLETLA